MRNTPGSVVFAANYSHLFNLFGEADGKNQPRREIKWVPQSLEVYGKSKSHNPRDTMEVTGFILGIVRLEEKKKLDKSISYYII